MNTNTELDNQLIQIINSGQDDGASLAALEALIRKGANVHSKSELSKYPALSLAVWRGSKEVVSMLLQNGANPNRQNEDTQWNAFHEACYTPNPKILKILFTHSALREFPEIDTQSKIDMQSEAGRTPLHLLALSQDDGRLPPKMARLMIIPFILWQADRTLKDGSGKSAEEHSPALTDIIDNATKDLDAIASRYNFFITGEDGVQSIDYTKCQEWFKLTPDERIQQYCCSHFRWSYFRFEESPLEFPLEVWYIVRGFLHPAKAPHISQHKFPRLKKSQEAQEQTALSCNPR